MGRASRHRPERLAEKLLQIRNSLELSQNQMIALLGSPTKEFQANISGYERGLREPPMLIVLRYAQVAGVIMDVLVDDDLDLPDKLPCTPKHPGIPREKTKTNIKTKK